MCVWWRATWHLPGTRLSGQEEFALASQVYNSWRWRCQHFLLASRLSASLRLERMQQWRSGYLLHLNVLPNKDYGHVGWRRRSPTRCPLYATNFKPFIVQCFTPICFSKPNHRGFLVFALRPFLSSYFCLSKTNSSVIPLGNYFSCQIISFRVSWYFIYCLRLNELQTLVAYAEYFYF